VEIPVPDLVEMWGPGYSIPSSEGNEAIAMMMRLEGIVLDTCYTGKAFAGLVRRAREGFYKPTDNVLFVHTGGAGGLFAQDWEEIVEISEDETAENTVQAVPEEKANPASASGIMDEITKAKQLLDAGILTEQEFTDLKAKVIAKL
jgi:hypothetical protein